MATYDKNKTKSKILRPITELCTYPPISKITVIGLNSTGSSIAVSFLFHKLSDTEICLFDPYQPELAQANLYDFQSCSGVNPGIKYTYAKDYQDTANSRILIISIEPTDDKVDEYDLSPRKTFKEIIPALAKYSPQSIIIVTTYPYNPLAYIALRLSGFPKHRVFSLGCCIDTIRFRMALSKHFNVTPHSCRGWIVGVQLRHFNTVVWSTVSVAGTMLTDLSKSFTTTNNPQNWRKLYKKINPSYIVSKNESSNFVVGASVATICESIINNARCVFSLSTVAKNIHGINSDIFLSLPCIVGANGIQSVVELNLTRYEVNFLRAAEKCVEKYFSDHLSQDSFLA